jgi:quercetin dioxygenase-like cupin family protein
MSDARERPIEKILSLDRRTVLERALDVALAGTIFSGLSDLAVNVAAAEPQRPATSGSATEQGIRRIITGNNAQGKSYVVSDERTSGGAVPNLFRTSGDDPLGPGRSGDSRAFFPSDSPQIEPALGGSSFHFVMLPPTKPGAKPFWHRTWTVDYNILLSGELVLMLDEGEVTLEPGAVVIQRNTMHAWRNPTDTPVRWVAVLVPIRR